jgi:beta-lactamase regulating signal transducer with metallopeptidase domain
MWPEWNTPLFTMLLESSLRTLVMAVAVAGILAAARIRSSHLRHRAWTVVLAAMLLMPFLSWVVPPVSMPSSRLSTLPQAVASVTRIPQEDKGQHPAIAVIPPAPSPARAAASMLPSLLLTGYAVGVAVLLVRQAAGWLAMVRLCGTLTPLHSANVFESSAIASPMVCGVIRPQIIVPSIWNEWSPQKFRAVLIHERAHIQRADPLVGFLARVNCAVFWFHPLAWWLERKLALTAEQACDDAVVLQSVEPHQYAEMLLEIAEAVCRQGARVSWQGIGVEGRGTLRFRIDRLLSCDVPQRVSTIRKVTVAVLLGTTVYMAAACRQSPGSADEIAQLRKEVSELRAEIRSLGGRPDTVDLNSRNPFHVPDVPNPDGADVKKYAPTIDFLGKGGDPNAEQWASAVTVPSSDRSSIDGEWLGRWNTNGGPWVRSYRAQVRTIGDRVYILYRDHQGRFLADLHRENDLLVGRLVGIDNPADTSLCVVRIVGTDRLDGTWDANNESRKGRLDFRRQFQ